MDVVTGWLDPTYLWLILGVVLIVVEILFPGVILVFFGLGALATAVVTRAVHISLLAQVLTFLIASLVLLFALRSWLKGVFRGRVAEDGEPDEDDHLVGRYAVVTAAIRPRIPGRVELYGSTWSAEAEAEIPEGATVKVVGKSSITLKVESAEKG